MWELEDITPLEFKRANDLYGFLDEANETWQEAIWIFRGQNDATWTLHPKAMRPCPLIDIYVDERLEKKLKAMASDWEFSKKLAQIGHHFYSQDLGWLFVKDTLPTFGPNFDNRLLQDIVINTWLERHLDQVKRNWVIANLHANRERHLVMAFVHRADQTGLSVPQDPFDNLWSTPFSFGERALDAEMTQDEPDRKEYANISYALAQHHGLPTRLLDWTYRPHVAAYFAANVEKAPAKLPPSEPEQIAIWAVERDSLIATNLRTVTHRRSDIGFVQAQDGVFLYDMAADAKFQIIGQWQPFEMELADVWRDNSDKVLKLVLPFEEREPLLRLLKARRVSMPFLMPTFDNVAKEIREGKIQVTEILGK